MPIRTLHLTDKGARVLWWDRLGIPIPPGYHAWGAADSALCPNGHLIRRGRSCQACALMGSFDRLRSTR